jgi:multidrug transporter EmrE-like cation transporter
MIKIIIYMLVFWLMQVIAQLLFKWGSTTESRWIGGFLLGNLFGFSSIWLLMLIYKEMNPNVALGLAMGGAFLLAQVALIIVLKSDVTLVQWFGIVSIVVGIVALGIGGTR